MDEMQREYYSDDEDALLMVTEACNSNCIMCPMGEGARKRGRSIKPEDVQKELERLGTEVSHLDITGGEPFLKWEIVLQAMKEVNQKYPELQVLILTNGRALCLPFIQEKIAPLITENYQFAIPLHAENAELHDAITRSDGSFQETVEGLHFLSATDASIEVRIVCHQLNKEHIEEICKMLTKKTFRITVVNFIGMEMNGNAARNREQLWIDYSELFTFIKPGIHLLMQAGIDVGLYDFPLCSIPRAYWALAKKSISEYKIRYPKECDTCIEKPACGGLFRSTYLLNLYQVNPIRSKK